MSYDIQPMITIKEKNKLLKKMHEENWILFLNMTLIFRHVLLIGMEINIKKRSVTISE